MTVVKVTDQTTRAEIAGVLAEANWHAKRKPHVVGDETLPTAWDVAHDLLDHLLTDWERADA